MTRHATLVELLQAQRRSTNGMRLVGSGNVETWLSYQDLWDRATRLLGKLRDSGKTVGDEVIIVTASNEKLLVAFWAAVLGGLVPVPVAVGISDEHRHKIFRIARQLRAPMLVTDEDLLERLRNFARDNQAGNVTGLLDTALLAGDGPAVGDDLHVYEPQRDDIAFVQYSSGSTSDPKGVCLSHRNVTSTVHAQAEGLALVAGDSTLSWMPLTHDMGLIGFHLTPLAAGLNQTIIDTSVFVRNPLVWLSRASEHRVTTLCSPNFGYKHYLKLFERKQPRDLDLSCVRRILNGAEPISIELCDQFVDALAPLGLRRNTMFPVYGLAEATLAVTFPELDAPYSAVSVRRHSMQIGEPLEFVAASDADVMQFMKLGTAVSGCEYRIVDDDDAALADGRLGNIQLHGDNITQGIYRDEETTREIFTADGWLRTGDCGATVDGQLVVTGRAKEIIIVNGQNYYPHDIEEIIARHGDFELGKLVVAGANRPGQQGEELLVFVLYRKEPGEFPVIADTVRDVVARNAALDVDRVIPVGRIPKTTSGKIQRRLLVEAYLDGEYDAVLAAVGSGADTLVQDGEDRSDEDPMVVELENLAAEFTKERRIGPDENLFEVGLTSLTLAEIMLALDEKYPGAVDINDLFDHPTIRELAAFLKSKTAQLRETA